MTNEDCAKEIRGMVDYWQRQLRLQDWDIQIVVPEHDPGGFGLMTHHSSVHRATMTVRNPAMKPPSSLANNDLEVTVVHELLHLRFHNSQFQADSADDKIHELAIERTAEAFVAINRGERRS